MMLNQESSLEHIDSAHNLKRAKQSADRKKTIPYILDLTASRRQTIYLFLAIGYPLTSLYNIHGGGSEQFNTTARPTENFYSTLKACHICPINW